MQLTQEKRRTRWLVMGGVWLLCGTLILLHTAAVRDYVALLNGAGLRESEDFGLPLRQVIPARHADAHMWVRHALAAEESGVRRIRFTDADNAPTGREVHWSSAFSWLLRGAGALHRNVTGAPMPQAMERMLLWFNGPLLIALVVLLSSWAARQVGAGAGAVVALGMVGHDRFYAGFAPTNVDHHGVVTATVLGLLLGAALMGAGWWRPAGKPGSLLPSDASRARRAAIVSALCGAVGMWLSAAAVMPVIVIVGLAGLAMAWGPGREALREGAHFEPGLWRVWGRVGAGASAAFYLLEYAPSNFSLRLEVNHPLYALAWWGGSELVAILAAWRLASGEPIGRVSRRLLLPALALAAPPLVVLSFGSAAFAPGDPFVGALRHFVAEGRSLPATVRQSGFGAVAYDLASCLLLILAGIIFRRRRGAARMVLGFLTVTTALLVAMSFWEMRWWLNTSAAQIILLLALLAAVGEETGRSRWPGVVVAVALLLLPPGVWRIVADRKENQARRVVAGDLLPPLYRDLAATLRAAQPSGDIVLLTDPNASAGISYFGRFKSLGTLYWENAAGLRAAATIFCARSEAEAAALIRARGITHIVLLPAANFIGEYFQLLHPRAPAAEARQTFGYRLLDRQPLPPWLQPIPYRAPRDLRDAAKAVTLFNVAFDQTELEQLFHAAVARAAEGAVGDAEKLFANALAAAPAEARGSMSESAGAAFYEYGADAAATRIFRRRLEIGFDATTADTLSWILATSSDATVRNGREALALVEARAVRNGDDPTLLSTLAAALAEVGRFEEATRAAERALALVQASGDRAAEPLLQRRLETYRAGRPWRQ